MNYTIDTNNSILFTPTLSFQKNNSISDMVGQTFQNEVVSLNQTINSFQNDQNAYNLSGQLLYRHRFSKPGRTLSLNANGQLNHNKANTILDALNVFTDTTLNSLLDQSGDLRMNTNSVGANLNYTEPVSKNSYIQARYGLNYQHGNSDKFTYNLDPTSEIVLGMDTLLTNVYATNYLTNSAGLAYRIVDKKVNATFGLNYQNGRLNSATDLPIEGVIIRHYNNLLPYASFQIKFNKTNNLSLFYNTSTQSPSVTQLQGVVNNQNPLQLSSGNPDLNQSYTHNVRIRFRSANADKSLSVFGMLSGTYTQHYIGTNTLVAPHDTILGNGFALANGSRFTTQENMDGYWNTTAFGGVGMPLYFLKSNLNINANLGYQRLPGIVNNATNFANNASAGLGLTLSSNISEMIDFTVSTRGTFNNVKNTVNTQSDNRFYNQMTRISANYVFWKGFSIGTDITHQFYTGLSKGFNQSYALWNLNVAKKLFKDQAGEIKASVYDLLGQNQSIQRTVSEIYSQDVMSNVLTRYFMLTFTYNLRSFYGAQQGNTNGRNFGGGNRGVGRF